MAYINCKKCGCQMSDKSEACPMCGTPVNADVEEINKGDDHSLNKKISDYDTVRNKAYKEMDEELEKTLNERKSIFYNLEEKEEDILLR